jgi:hypothetical protein
MRLKFDVSWNKRIVHAGYTRYDRYIAYLLARCDIDLASERASTGESR